MRSLLSQDTFDDWELVRCKLVKGNTFEIDGRRVPEFYDDEPSSENIYWIEIKPWILEIIKGKKTPILVNIILKKNLPNDDNSYMLNISFANKIMVVTTGVSYKVFDLDNRQDKQWDDYIEGFLDKLEISYKENE